MFTLIKPSQRTLAAWMPRQRAAQVFTTDAAIPQPAPRGFRLNLGSTELGSGEEVYRAACDALRNWEMFPGKWIEVLRPETPVEVGQTVGVLARGLGVWSLNACRVVGMRETSEGALRSCGFTYATVGEHVYCGAELFAVLFDESSGRVWYELASYSQARHWLVKLMAPYVRSLQRRFAVESGEALLAAVARRAVLRATSI
jgi:uncharacterized protein (UPF0548 family)